MFVNPSRAWPPETRCMAADGAFAGNLKHTFLYFQTRDKLGITSLSPDPLPYTGPGLPLHITSVTS